jgi:GTP-binding protein YchF
MKIGIIGLPNVGKSTTFNALIKEQNAEVANYPFCTIEPNKAIVPVPDARLDRLAELVGVSRVIHATVQFMDVAGLVKGASQGEGLGNQFLGNIRDVDAILHVVRCFDDPNVVHVSAKPDPENDIDVINTELALADLQQLERRIEKLESQIKGDIKLKPMFDLALDMKDALGRGQPLWLFAGRDDPNYNILNSESRFLTAKPVIYAANVDENGLVEDGDYVTAARRMAEAQHTQIFKLCAKLEEDIAQLPPEEAAEYLSLSGITESGLDQLIRAGFQLLGLISFFTFNEEEVRAWTIHQGITAPQAASVIHTDFERGFIQAQIAEFEVFEQHGSWAALKAAGLLRIEGKEYVVQDGEVIKFRFNV